MNIDYYNKNADSFDRDTANVNMEETYAAFTEYLCPGARILDAGCGSGRDTLAFLEMGYKVEAFDASAEMVNIASRVAGINIQKKRFNDIEYTDCYDGIWCCASLLHVSLLDLPMVMNKLGRALKPGGVWYVSFKYGTAEREEEGRFFTDLNEKSLKHLIDQVSQIQLLNMWITTDVRPGRSDKWLNGVLQKDA